MLCATTIDSKRSEFGYRFDSFFVFELTCLIVRPRSADELDAATTTARGGDASGEMRRLEDALKRLRESFQEAKRLALGSEEAAAKCQVRTHAVPGWNVHRDRRM